MPCCCLSCQPLGHLLYVELPCSSECVLLMARIERMQGAPQLAEHAPLGLAYQWPQDMPQAHSCDTGTAARPPRWLMC